jgi:methylated-DNA-[protein]-cysteine S-methyltransferase
LRKREIVYTLLSLVPPGYVVTYSLLARLAGTSPRAIGAIMKANRRPIVVPCHRVVSSDGRLGGYSLGGPSFKERLLRLEGVEVRGGRVDEKHIVRDVEAFWRLLEEEGGDPIYIEDC